jgi:ATP-binding cassette subfamily C protein CydD
LVAHVFIERQSLVQLTGLLLFLSGTLILRAALIWLREWTAQECALRVKADLRERLFAHLLELGPTYTKHERTGELVATLSDGIERLDAYISRYLPQIIYSVCIPLLICVYLFPIDWISSVLLLVTAPIIPLLMALIGSYAEDHTQKQWEALSGLSAHFLDTIQGLPTLKIFGRSQTAGEHVHIISNHFRDRTMKVLRVAFLSGMVLEFMSSLAIALIAVTLGIRLINRDISFETALLILLLAPEFYRPLRDLGLHRHAGMEGKAAAKRIDEIMQMPVVLQPSAESSPRPQEHISIEFTNVSYSYPQSERPALSGINLTLDHHTCSALIGRSGAGKSTLVNLLLRFIDCDSGCITVNGMPLTAIAGEVWREFIALVPQRPYLFYGSVEDNIRLARPTASRQEVIQAAELAGASEFIAQLPQDYATLIGERGNRLSAGQVQRLAIARAFLKDAPLLILDEPTSSLDPQSERHIQQALARLMHNRTVLVIAHRSNTIRHAKQIAVLADGQLVEVGSQLELRNGQNSMYTQLMQRKVQREQVV